MSPFFGPFSLGGQPAPAAANQLQKAIPGAQISSFAGPGGGTNALGFTNPGPVLFRGQPLSSTDTFSSAPPLATGSTGSQPDSLTALLSGLSTPSLPAISTAPIRPAVGGALDVSGGGVSSTEGPSAGNFAAGPASRAETAAAPPSDAGYGNAFSNAIETVGHALSAVSANTPAAAIGGRMGVSPGWSNVAGSVVTNAIGGPIGALLSAVNTGMGLYGALGETSGMGVPGLNISQSGAKALDTAVMDAYGAAGGGAAGFSNPGGMTAEASAAGGDNSPSAGFGETGASGVSGSAHGNDGVGGGMINKKHSEMIMRYSEPGSDTDSFAWKPFYDLYGLHVPIQREGALVFPSYVPDQAWKDFPDAKSYESQYGNRVGSLFAGVGADGGPGPGAPGEGPGGGSGGDGGGDGGTVICTELYRQGYLSRDLYQLDQQFGEWVCWKHPEVYAGYIAWAPSVVRAMRRYPFIARITAPFVRAWARSMACLVEPQRKPSLLGGLMMALGVPLCRMIGRRRKPRVQPTYDGHIPTAADLNAQFDNLLRHLNHS